MKNQISARQAAVIAFAGGLAPCAAVAGLDWRGAILAVPVVMVAAWIVAALSAGPGGFAGRLTGWGGKLLSLIYIVGGVFAAGTELALCGQRLSATAGNGGTAGWMTALAVLPVLWLALGRTDTFARAAEVFYLALAVLLGLVLLLGAGQVEGGYLFAQRTDLWPCFVTAAGTGCLSVYAVLLWRGGEQETGRLLGWSGAGAGALVLMSAVTVGSLSPALTGAVAHPFFVMTVGLGATGRTEALVSALWLLADVTFAGGLICACRQLCITVWGCKWPKRAGTALTAAALGMGLFAQKWGSPAALMAGILPVGGLILGGGVPAVLWMLERCRGGPR